jgi:hypothetical protein
MVFGKRIDKPGGSRRAVREGVMLPAALMTTTDSATVDLLDLSKSGAKLRGRSLPSPGQEVLVVLGRLEAFGSVIWRDEDECGVHFDVALTERAVSIVKSERGLASLRGVPGEDLLAASDWQNGLAR